MDEIQNLRKLWGGFRAARVVITANNFGIFDHMQSSKSADEIASVLTTDLRATEILLDALAGLGLLKKSGGRYRNTPMSSKFLVKGSPLYQGDMIRHADTLWQNWSCLDDALKTGKPCRKASNRDAFIKGMHNNAVMRAGEVVKAIDLRKVRSALDLGGGPGTYSIEMAKKSVTVTLFDLPDAIAIARELADKSGVKGVNFREGDVLADDIGIGYDLVFISQLLHIFSADDNIRIIKKAQDSLNPGGRIVIQEFLIDKGRTTPVQSALFSVNMLINSDSGRCYAVPEMKKWLSEAGFRNIKHRVLSDTVLVSAMKAKKS